jgi:hypothetical protein
MQKANTGIVAQFPFIPVHKDVLEEVVQDGELIGEFTPADISDSLRSWKRNEGGYFTIPVDQIWTLAIKMLESSGKLPKDYMIERDNDMMFLFPPIYISKKQDIEASYVVKLTEMVGESFDPRSN